MKRFLITTFATLALLACSPATASDLPPTHPTDVLEVNLISDIDLPEACEFAQDTDTMTQDYIGTKRVTAWPQNAPADQHGSETLEGYAVKYADGYVSWSPKDVFEAAYQPVTTMSFGHALQALNEGERVARAGWNGKNMWLQLIDPYAKYDQFSVTESAGMQGTLTVHPWMKTADNKLVPWLCSLTDMMAEDWLIYEAPPTSA